MEPIEDQGGGSEVILGLPKTVRLWMYLAAFVGNASLTPITMAATGLTQNILTGIQGGLSALILLIAGVATRSR